MKFSYYKFNNKRNIQNGAVLLGEVNVFIMCNGYDFMPRFQ